MGFAACFLRKIRLTAWVFLSRTVNFCFTLKCMNSTQPPKTHLLNNETVLLLMSFATGWEGDMIQKINYFKCINTCVILKEKTSSVAYFLLAQVSQIP